ncbi:MAG: FadR family transcriptional regulator [Bauldia sp.]|nr:FadR family transcriptional regulator [Bauldia sp.]
MTARSSTGEAGSRRHEAAGRAYADGGKVHGAVVRKLAAMVMGGRYAPGEGLPREGDLADAFGVSRTSLREAMKVLSAKGLIEARPRTGVRVRPRSAWNLLDPAVLAWHPDLTGDRDLMRSLIETRRVIEPAAAGMAAARASAADLATIEAAYLRIAAAIPDDLDACREGDIAFHRAVIDASHNLILTRLIDTVEAALRAVFTVTNRMMAPDSEALSAHRDVLERIRMRDQAGAAAAMDRLIDVAAADLARTKFADLVPDGTATAPPDSRTSARQRKAR